MTYFSLASVRARGLLIIIQIGALVALRGAPNKGLPHGDVSSAGKWCGGGTAEREGVGVLASALLRASRGASGGK